MDQQGNVYLSAGGGKYLFFQSVRPGSAPGRSFYWVDARVIELLRPSIATGSARATR